MNYKTYPDTYKEIKKIGSEEIDFLAGYFINKCVGIYDTNYYPLLVAHEKDEELEIYNNTDSNYIIKKVKGEIVAIYNSKARKIFEIKNGQKVTLLSNDLEKFDMSLKPTSYEKNLFVNLYLKDCTCLYNVTNKKYILTSSFENSEFYLTNNFILEAQGNIIKAVYSYNSLLNPIIKTKHGSLRILSFLHDYFITESDNSNKCHTIYYVGSTSCRAILQSTYDLNLSLSYYSSVLDGYEPETMIITGKLNNKCKSIYFLDISTAKIRRYKTLKYDDERYFEIDNSGIIKVILKGKCVKLLDHKFKSILSVRNSYKKSSNINVYLEIHSEYIAKMYKEKCIAIYSLKTQELLANTTDLNIDIKTCKSKYTDLYFLHMLNGKCVEITGNARSISLPDTTYEVHLSPTDNTVDYVYGIRNEKVVGVFDFNLRCIDWLKSTSTESFKVINTFMYTDVKKDAYDTEYKQLCQKILYFKKDSSGNLIEVFDERKNSVFKACENGYLKLFGNFILSYKDDKCNTICIINNSSIIKKIVSKDNYFFIPFTSKSEKLFIKKFNSISHKEHLYYLQNKDLIEIASDYNELFDCEEFFLTLKNNSQTSEIIEIKTFYSNKEHIISLTAKHNGTLKLEVDDPKKFIYVMEQINSKNIAIYSVTKDGFDEILNCDSGIEPIYVGNDIFFETSEGIYNKVGNKL